MDAKKGDGFVLFVPSDLDNYTPFADELLKTVIYVHNRHPYVERLLIPSNTTTVWDETQHHYCTWILIHSDLTLSEPIVVGCYYKSPRLERDIDRLRDDMHFISRRLKRQNIRNWLITGDFNLHSVEWALSWRVPAITAAMRDEYEILDELQAEYELELLNAPNQATWRRVVDLDLRESVLDLTFASMFLVRLGFTWELLNLNGSDHSAVLTTFTLPCAQHRAQPASEPSQPELPDPNAAKWRFGDPINEDKYVESVSQNVASLLAQVKSRPLDRRTIDDAGYQFFRIVHEAAHEHIGVTTRPKHAPRKAWCTKQCVIAIAKCAKLYKRWKRCQRDYKARRRARVVYKSMCRKRNRILYAAKKRYLDRLGALLDRFNHKEWWSTLKTLRRFNVPQRAEIGFIEHAGRRVECDREKADLFNHKYCHQSYDLRLLISLISPLLLIAFTHPMTRPPLAIYETHAFTMTSSCRRVSANSICRGQRRRSYAHWHHWTQIRTMDLEFMRVC